MLARRPQKRRVSWRFRGFPPPKRVSLYESLFREGYTPGRAEELFTCEAEKCYPKNLPEAHPS